MYTYILYIYLYIYILVTVLSTRIYSYVVLRVRQSFKCEINNRCMKKLNIYPQNPHNSQNPQNHNNYYNMKHPQTSLESPDGVSIAIVQ